MKQYNKKNLYIGAMLVLSTYALNAQDIVIDSDSNKTKENIVKIRIPKVPDVPKVEAIVPKIEYIGTQPDVDEEIRYKSHRKKEVIFSKRVPPWYGKKEETFSEKADVGEVANGRISAYLQAPLISKKEVKSKIEKAGFNILTSFSLDKKGTLTSIVFSDKSLDTAASKKNRGFAGALRVLVDEKNSQISITNPIYMMKAFMQEEYDEKIAKDTLKRLRDTFDELKNSKDLMKFRVLERFQFMSGMPFYKDMKVVAKGKNQDLLEKAKKSKKVVYEHKLSNGSTIIGVKLSRRTSKFVKKIGYQNSGLLPYPVLIEDGKAKILAPKYYIAVMYPMLKMSQFMSIATIPGAIEKDCDKVFR